jgi:hypothetical protein
MALSGGPRLVTPQAATSVTITERYYAKWNKAQQDILDG